MRAYNEKIKIILSNLKAQEYLILSFGFLLITIHLNFIYKSMPIPWSDVSSFKDIDVVKLILLSALSAAFGNFKELLYILTTLIYFCIFIAFITCYIKSIINTVKKADNSISNTILSTFIPLIYLVYFCPKLIYAEFLIFFILLIIKLKYFKNYKYYPLLMLILSIVTLIVNALVF